MEKRDFKKEVCDMNTIYCVTGAGGHLGNNIVKQLINQGKTVRAFEKTGQDTSMLCGAEIFYGDVTDKSTLAPFLAKTDQEQLVVIHAAGIVSITEKYDAKVFAVNYEGTKNVVDACIEAGVSKFVYVGSVHAAITKKGVNREEDLSFDADKVCGNYAKSKSLAVQYVLEAAKNGFDACVVLPSGILGPNDYGHNHITDALRSYISGKLPAAAKGGYDFVDVRDAAQAIIAASQKGKKGELYLVSGGAHSMKEILDYAADTLGIKKMRTYLPQWFLLPVAWICEAVYRIKKRTPLFTAYSIKVLNSKETFCCDKAKIQLDFEPRSARQTTADTVLWLTQNGTTIGKKMLIKEKPAKKTEVKSHKCTDS